MKLVPPAGWRDPWYQHRHVMEETGRWYDRRYNTVHWCAKTGKWLCPDCTTEVQEGESALTREERAKLKKDRFCAPAQQGGKNRLKHCTGCKCCVTDPNDPEADNRGGRPQQGRKKKAQTPLEEAVANNAEVMRLTSAVEEQQGILNAEVQGLKACKDLCDLKAELKLARERAALEVEAEGDLVEGVVPKNFGSRLLS